MTLLNAIKEYEQNKWKVIGAKVGKPAKVSRLPPPDLVLYTYFGRHRLRRGGILTPSP